MNQWLHFNEQNAFWLAKVILIAMFFLFGPAERTTADCKSTMDLRWFPSLVIVACVLRTSPGCPSTCRCYSLTVECGSLGLKEIPQGLPFTTEVSWSNRQ